MVFLTLSCWIRNRGPDRYWKVQELLKHARHFRGRKNRCYSLAVRAVRRSFIYASKARKAKRRSMRTCVAAACREHSLKYPVLMYNLVQLWISRVAAACREHSLKYPVLMYNLVQCSVQLNRRVLSDLAVTEPRSFQALVSLARARQREGLWAALGDGKEPPGVFSRITQLQ